MRVKVGLVLTKAPIDGAILSIDADDHFANVVYHPLFEEITIRLGGSIPIYTDYKMVSRRGLRISDNTLKLIKKEFRNGCARKPL